MSALSIAVHLPFLAHGDPARKRVVCAVAAERSIGSLVAEHVVD